MIDDATIKKLGEEYARVMSGLETLLDSELDDEEDCALAAEIAGHLIRVELGRAATREEFALLIKPMDAADSELRGQFQEALRKERGR